MYHVLKILLFLVTRVEHMCLHVGACSRVQDQGSSPSAAECKEAWGTGAGVTVVCGCWDELRSSGRATSQAISPARDWKG